MGAGVVDDHKIADLDRRQGAVDGELVVVLAEAADDVAGVVRCGALFAEHRDMVVGAGDHPAVFVQRILPVSILQ